MKKIALVAAGILFMLSVAAQENRVAVPLDNSPSFGPADAQVTIVEFIDFQ